jgi:hypothetical protein
MRTPGFVAIAALPLLMVGCGRPNRPKRRLGDDDDESERLKAWTHCRIATTEVSRAHWPELGMLVAMRSADDCL